MPVVLKRVSEEAGSSWVVLLDRARELPVPKWKGVTFEASNEDGVVNTVAVAVGASNVSGLPSRSAEKLRAS